MTMSGKGERGASGADTRVHYRGVDCTGREAMPGAPQDVGAGPDVRGWDAVADVYDHGGGSSAEKYTLHFCYIRICRSEVREKSDDGHSGKVRRWERRVRAF
jgi:hypothetical protein